MKRRDFFRYSALGGTTLTLGGITACEPVEKPTEIKEQEADYSFELDEITIDQLQEGMESGALSSRSIVQMYLDRIDKVDKNGPAINSVIEVNPDALSIADQMDQERHDGNIRGPLHGIPIMIKDNIDTADKMMTTAGSLALMNSIAPQDAFIVDLLRKAGAVLVGKTNLSEWANFRSTRSSSGWSGRGGQTKNPYVTNRNPCGSSAGTAAAVAANLCTIGIGTETNGSIVCPSSANGLVGIKPTLGLWSRTGIIPIAHSQDTAGPMVRTVRDGAILLGALTGADHEDEITTTVGEHGYQDYTQFLDENGLDGARIGVYRRAFGFHEKVDALMEAAIEMMKSKGAIVVDPVEMPSLREVGRAGITVLNYEFKADLKKYLERLGPGARMKTLDDVIEFNKNNQDTSMPYFGQERMLGAQEAGDLNDEEYLEALEKVKRLNGPEGIDAVIEEHQLDVIIAPTGGPAWVTDLVNGDHFGGGSSSAAARAGYPNITIPAGFVHGLPVGLSFFAGAFTEPALLKITYAFEQATKHRQPPRFLEKIA